MSEILEVGTELPALWRVRKSADDSIFGPVDERTLREWAHSAQISPQDLIDISDGRWRPAPDVEFLEMIWTVVLPENETYGPTTVGTLREFIHEGLISEKTIARNVKTQQSLPVAAVFASLEAEKRRAHRPPMESNKSTASIAVEMAKDQRIRQLEEDLKTLRQEHETLVQKYRQLNRQQAGSSGKL